MYKDPQSLRWRSWFPLSMPSRVGVVLSVLLTGQCATAQLSPARQPTGVTPEPQEVFNLSGSVPFNFDAQMTITFTHLDDRIAAEILAKDVKDRSGLDVLIKSTEQPVSTAKRVEIRRVDDKPLTGHIAGVLQKLGETQAEGYRLVIQRDRIVIEGHDTRGALYGVQTLRQLLQKDLKVPSLAIRDWPEMPLRIAYGNFAGRIATDKAGIDEFLESAVMAKMNMVVLETLWNHHQNWWFNPTDDRAHLGAYFFEQARKLHIDPVPLVQGPGWGYGVTDLDPMLTEGVWLVDEPVVLTTGASTILRQRNVVTNAKAPILVKSQDGQTQYTLNEDFKVLPGVTRRPYDEAAAPWSLQAIEGGRIVEGQTVLVSYNHVTPHAHKAYCLSDSDSYVIIDRAIDDVMTRLKPKYIHIGHDEIWDLATDSRCLNSGLRPEELVLKNLLYVYNRIKKHDPEATIMMWDDLFDPERSHVSKGILTGLVAQVPKDIVLCPWIYHTEPSQFQRMKAHLMFQTGLGFKVIGTSSGYWMTNSRLWYTALQPYLKNGTALGMMFTEWEAALNGSNMIAAAELMWSGQKTNPQVFAALEAITGRLKGKSFALTYPLSSVRQREATVAYFTAATAAGQSPDDAVAAFRKEVIGDTSIFQQTYGDTTWKEMRTGPIYIQQVAMVQRIPAYLEAVALYLQAEKLQRTGSAALAQTMLNLTIERLASLGMLTHDAAMIMRERVKREWLPSTVVFGFALPTLP